MIERLKALALAGRIRQLDLQFARLVADLGGSPELVLGPRSPAMSWGAAMSACRWRCLLRAVTGRDPAPLRAGSGSEPGFAGGSRGSPSWPALFAASPLVGSEQEEGDPRWPLRLWGDRLYHPLPRLWAGVARHLARLRNGPNGRDCPGPVTPVCPRLRPGVPGPCSRPASRRISPSAIFVGEVPGSGLPHEVEWPAVETLLKGAQAASELERLDTLVPGRSAATARSWRRPRRRRARVISRRPRHRQDHHGGQAPRHPGGDRPAGARPRRSGWWPPPASRRRRA